MTHSEKVPCCEFFHGQAVDSSNEMTCGVTTNDLDARYIICCPSVGTTSTPTF